AREVDRDPRRIGSIGEHLERITVDRLAAVRVEQLADRLADDTSAGEVGRGCVDALVLEPGREPVVAALEVDGVDEPLHEPDRLRRSVGYVVPGRFAWRHLRHQYKLFTG